MSVLLITALRAAETLAAYHRWRAEQTAGSRRRRHHEIEARCRDDIEDIRQQIADSAVTPEHQAGVVRSQDLKVAQKIITEQLPHEWRPDVRAPHVMEQLAQAMADAMQVARGATPNPSKTDTPR